MGLFDWIPFVGKSKEKSTIELMQEQMNLVCKSVENTRMAVEALTEKNKSLFVEKREAVNSLEEEIDCVTRQIEENLYSGAFLAVSRSRILDLVEDVDDVADAAKDVVNIGDIMVEHEMSGEFNDLIRRHMNATVECVGYLKECFDSIDDHEKLPELIKKVRKQEHEVDEIAKELFHLIRKPDYDAKDFLLLSKMIEFMDEISDRSEAASDTLKLVMLVHMP